MKTSFLHGFEHLHAPMRMELMAWLSLFVGVLLGVLCYPENPF